MKKIIGISFMLCAAAFSSCWYDHKWEKLHPYGQNAGPSLSGCADTTGVTISYANDIASIVTTSCAINGRACHAPGSVGGDLTTYSGISGWCSGGSSCRLLTDLEGTTNPMPKGMTPLAPCDIAKFAKWVRQGYPNN